MSAYCRVREFKKRLAAAHSSGNSTCQAHRLLEEGVFVDCESAPVEPSRDVERTEGDEASRRGAWALSPQSPMVHDTSDEASNGIKCLSALVEQPCMPEQ
jgi:hypothetical protein